AIMDENPNFAALGAFGPDLFFFLPDFRDLPLPSDPNGPGIPTASVLVGVLGFLEQVYAAVDPYIGKWEHFLGPISEDTAEEMSRLAGGLPETVGDISGELNGILTTLLEDLAGQQGGLWGFFSLGLNKGWDDRPTCGRTCCITARQDSSASSCGRTRERRLTRACGRMRLGT